MALLLARSNGHWEMGYKRALQLKFWSNTSPSILLIGDLAGWTPLVVNDTFPIVRADILAILLSGAAIIVA